MQRQGNLKTSLKQKEWRICKCVLLQILDSDSNYFAVYHKNPDFSINLAIKIMNKNHEITVLQKYTFSIGDEDRIGPDGHI